MRRWAMTLGVALTMLAACSGSANQIGADISTIGNGLAGLLPLFTAAKVTIPANVQAQVTTAIGDIDSESTAIGKALTTPATGVQAVQNDVNLIATLVSPYLPQAAAAAPLVDAAVALVGTVLAEAGMLNAGATAPPKYTADEARAILKAAAIPKH